MIPAVVVTDLGWAALVLATYWKSPSKRTRKLLLALLAYVAVEVVLHERMEILVAEAMGLL